MVGMLSDIGNVRKNNEDYLGYFEDNEKRIYVVADGMGGHNAGEVASKIAVETTMSYMKNVCNFENLAEVLINSIESANKKIYELSMRNEDYNGMGTTITACLIKDKSMVVANVGDSSCYIIKDHSLNKVTRDHSLVQQLVDNGSITKEQALYHPNKNILTRALGTNINVKVDVFDLELTDIYKVVMCTDGLTNSVTNDEIYDIVSKNDSPEACKKLIELGKLKGGSDNISVMVFEGECKL